MEMILLKVYSTVTKTLKVAHHLSELMHIAIQRRKRLFIAKKLLRKMRRGWPKRPAAHRMMLVPKTNKFLDCGVGFERKPKS